ncbi:helix-turn-helix domain-containing protein [Alcaligenaceae bacterium]|nr:helix-turn-helix domain-containing protein [Alcaligenaceae bacterium]
MGGRFTRYRTDSYLPAGGEARSTCVATPESEGFVRTFARGLNIIEVMGQGTARQTLKDIAEAAGLPRTAVRRFLMTLISLSFVGSDGKHYWLTPKVLRLGMAYLYALPFWRHAQLALEDLGDRLGQSCAVAVLDGEEVVYVHRIHAKRILTMSPSLGSRLPAYAVSLGRILLANLDDAALADYLASAQFKPLTGTTVTSPDALRAIIEQVRGDRYAWVDGEYDEAIAGLSVAIRDQEGGVVGAVNVTLPAGTYDRETAVRDYLPELRQTASRLRAHT